jgi:hypothetical protein
MKTIYIKKDGKKIHQFIVHDSMLKIAKRLGISEEQFIIERSKVELEERKANEK